MTVVSCLKPCDPSPSRLLKKSPWSCLELGFVAEMVTKFDVEGAVVVEFGRAVAANFVHFVKAVPGEEDDAWRIFAIETGVQRAEGDLAATVAVEGDVGWPDEIEMVSIPYPIDRLRRCAIGR